MMTSTLNERSDRVAMGLSDTFTPTMAENLNSQIPSVLAEGIHQWQAILSNPKRSLQERWAAGSLLSLCEDPRITIFEPDLVTIEAATATIGLNGERFEDLCAELAHVNVLPAWIEKEMPEHSVRLNSYAIGRYPVTNREYLAFLRENPAAPLPTGWDFGIYPAARSNHPVYSIPVSAAVNYCRWLSSKTQRRFRLPTEAEWEYAAAGPAKSEYPWGDIWDSSRANTAELGLYQTTPIGMFSSGASWCGLLDLAGNVEEYTSDFYSPYPGGRFINDDLAVALGPYPIARGGSFTRFYDLARCKRRHGAYPKSIYVMGFRLAESL